MGMFESWSSLQRYDVLGPDRSGGCQHVLAGGAITLGSGPRVAEGRTQVVEQFLASTTCDWLLMIDSDMTFEPDALCQLLGHAYDGNGACDPFHPEISIIGALAFAGGRSRMYPTIYELKSQDGQIVPEQAFPDVLGPDYPRDTLVKCGGTGAAFLLVHRKVFLHMMKDHPNGFGTDVHGQRNPHPWFVEGQNAGIQFGEDLAFCMRAGSLGYPTYVHTGVKVGHIKTTELDEGEWDARRELAFYRENFGDKWRDHLGLPRAGKIKELVLP